MLTPPASIGLYVHIPWCVRKCPYCDFNSHAFRESFPEREYVECLVQDLASELERVEAPIETVYFGGGTPSLFQPDSFACILQYRAFHDAREVTMEANPGTVEYNDLAAYRAAGISRISIGVQSLHDQALKLLGRIHSAAEARTAVFKAQNAGFESINLDLMYGLPEQSLNSAMDDLDAAIDLEPDHISWYQLTLEPNTVFAKYPPKLASDDERADMSEAGIEKLEAAGFRRYEVSAFSRNGDANACLHNLNYWKFGDYLGIGAGAHGKVSLPNNTIIRTRKARQPDDYMRCANTKVAEIPVVELPVEFMLNALRLVDGVEEVEFEARTGRSLDEVKLTVANLRRDNLMQNDRLALTPFGLNHLDAVVARFLD